MTDGDSTAARAFGARINIRTQGQGLYLVIGHNRSPAGLVNSAGGSIILELPGHRLIALLPIEAYFAFQRHPDIALTGPVTIAQERFTRFIATWV